MNWHYALSSPLRRAWRIRRKSRPWLSMASAWTGELPRGRVVMLKAGEKLLTHNNGPAKMLYPAPADDNGLVQLLLLLGRPRRGAASSPTTKPPLSSREFRWTMRATGRQDRQRCRPVPIYRCGLSRTDLKAISPSMGIAGAIRHTPSAQCVSRNAITAALKTDGSRIGASWLTFFKMTRRAPGMHFANPSLMSR